MKNPIGFLFGCTVMLFAVSLLSCSFNNKEDKEDIFKSRIYITLGKNSSVELDFTKLVDFEWSKVCFGYGPHVNILFYRV